MVCVSVVDCGPIHVSICPIVCYESGSNRIIGRFITDAWYRALVLTAIVVCQLVVSASTPNFKVRKTSCDWSS